MDDNKLIGIDENIEDCIVLDNKDEAGLVWKQIEAWIPVLKYNMVRTAMIS